MCIFDWSAVSCRCCRHTMLTHPLLPVQPLNPSPRLRQPMGASAQLCQRPPA